MTAVSDEKHDRAGRLHGESLVVDTMSPFGPDRNFRRVFKEAVG